MDRWRGQVAVVTGASAGIGAAIAVALAKSGIKVVGLARRAEMIEQHAKKNNVQVYGIKCDLTKENEIEEAFKQIQANFGPISILVNNAGVALPSSLSEGPVEVWRKTIDTNIIALSICTKIAIKSMKNAKIDGHIIHLNSLVGHRVIDFITRYSMYSPTKYAISSLTECLRLEFNRQNSKIKITSISPGYVRTDILGSSSAEEPSQEIWAALEVEDVADAVIYVLGTPPHVQVREVIMQAVGETF